jgi:hypothetical protein
MSAESRIRERVNKDKEAKKVATNIQEKLTNNVKLHNEYVVKYEKKQHLISYIF